MRKYLLLLLISLISIQSKSTHLMGGEITWQCLKSGPDLGKYIFTLKVYRDCNGTTAPTFTQFLDVWGHPSVSQISMNFIIQEDVSPNCNPIISGNPVLNCANGDVGAVEQYTYESLPVSLPGVPPISGWHFTWDNCCRNGAITNLVLSNTTSPSEGFTLRAGMFPFFDPNTGLAVPADPCFDSSPNFKEQPKTILCVGFPFSYSHNASDEELDSLVYSWGEPLDDNVPFLGGVYNPGPFPATPSTLPFTPPYTANSPLPGNPNLDSQTGEVSYNANIAGFYVTCVRVKAFRCSQLVSEVFREVQVVLIGCPFMPGGSLLPNNPPTVSAPFTDTLTMLPSYDTIVYAGQLVTFTINGVDGDLYNGITPQQLTMEVTGGQFSDNYLDSTQCLNPPCAQFYDANFYQNNPNLPILQQLPPPIVQDSGLVSGIFRWQTSCMHIAAVSGCGSTSNVFTFLVKVFDDFCPANGLQFATIKVTVLPVPVDNPPDPRCISVDDNGNVDLEWEHLLSAPPSTVYSVYHSNNSNGPFLLLDSVMYPNNSYKHISNTYNANIENQYYYLTSRSDCADESFSSDTLSTMLLNVIPINNNTVGDLSWNPIHTPNLNTSSSDYDIFAKDAFGSYQLVGSTSDLNFLFPAQTCNSYQSMYISLEDQSGCVSLSSIDGAVLEDTISPNPPVISDISVNSNGKSVITWTSTSNDVDIFEVYQKINGVWLTIGSVLAPNNSFEYSSSNAQNNYEVFSVRALDSCDNASYRSINHNSIYLNTNINVCDFTLEITWNEYINFTNGLSHYKLYIIETDTLGSLSQDSVRLNSLNYTINNINGGSNYYIYVSAYNSDSTLSAISNQINQHVILPSRPEFNYIESASVNHNNGFVEISCLIDNNADIDYYDVFRSRRKENEYYKIGEVVSSNNDYINFTDKNANSNTNFYNYRIFPVDTCGQRISAPSVVVSPFLNDTSYAQTILLSSEINIDYSDTLSIDGEYTNTINFNEYENWLGSVSEYRLYRSINGQQFNVLPLYVWDRENNPSEQLKYVDIVTEYGTGNGRFCYYIQAIEGSQNPYGPNLDGVYSNISCVSQTPIIFVPTVFTPNGDENNEIFLPITYYVSQIGYSFSVFNRNGMEIFTTDNPQFGWDGTYKGVPVQDGNYVYQIEYINGVGVSTKKINVVTLVR